MYQLFNIKSVITTLLIAGVLLLFAIIAYNNNINFDTLRTALALVSVLTIIILLGWRIIWKISVLNNWYPDLTGTWDITINWQDLKNGLNGKVGGTAEIKCSLHKITMTINTDGSNSETLCCHPRKTETERELLYIYSNRAKNNPNTKSQNQSGAGMLKVQNSNKLEGNYWTDTQTKGTIIFVKNS
jgi:hypothetical protein